MKKEKLDRVVAEGEATGHMHRFAEGARVWEDEGVILVENDATTPIEHQEHRAISIPPSPTGSYRIGQVQEVDHFAEEVRNVRD